MDKLLLDSTQHCEKLKLKRSNPTQVDCRRNLQTSEERTYNIKEPIQKWQKTTGRDRKINKETPSTIMEKQGITSSNGNRGSSSTERQQRSIQHRKTLVPTSYRTSTTTRKRISGLHSKYLPVNMHYPTMIHKKHSTYRHHPTTHTQNTSKR